MLELIELDENPDHLERVAMRGTFYEETSEKKFIEL